MFINPKFLIWSKKIHKQTGTVSILMFKNINQVFSSGLQRLNIEQYPHLTKYDFSIYLLIQDKIIYS